MHGEGPAVSTHAINIAPADNGWRWKLIDADGATAANGVAAEREDALKSARSAARTLLWPASGAGPKTNLAARRDAVGQDAA